MANSSSCLTDRLIYSEGRHTTLSELGLSGPDPTNSIVASPVPADVHVADIAAPILANPTNSPHTGWDESFTGQLVLGMGYHTSGTG